MSYLTDCFDQSAPAYYTCATGITTAHFPQLTELAESVYEQILSVLDSYGLEYYLFAGTLVGLVRNGTNPDWLDDLDIMIFEEDRRTFEDSVIPHLKDAGFICYRPGNHSSGGFHVLSMREGERKDARAMFRRGESIKVPRVQVDVFYSYVDNDGLVKNHDGWGLYHKKHIPIEWVRPAKRVNLFSRDVPVFNKYEEDVFHEYGDVLNNVVIATHGKLIFKCNNVSWHEISSELKDIRKKAINRSSFNRDASVTCQEKSQSSELNISDDKIGLCEIVEYVRQFNPTTLRLAVPHHFFWVMDIARLFPHLAIEAIVSETDYLSRVTHLAEYYTLITVTSPYLKHIAETQLTRLGMNGATRIRNSA